MAPSSGSVRTPPQSTTSARSSATAGLSGLRQQGRDPLLEAGEERGGGGAREVPVVRRLEQHCQLPDRQRDEPGQVAGGPAGALLPGGDQLVPGREAGG